MAQLISVFPYQKGFKEFRVFNHMQLKLSNMAFLFFVVGSLRDGVFWSN